MLLDAGFLVAFERGGRGTREYVSLAQASGTVLSTTHPVVAQVWRDGARQARLSRLLRALTILPFDDGRSVGALLAAAKTTDVVDAHLVITADRLSEPILTGDLDDLEHLAACLPHPGPRILHWR